MPETGFFAFLNRIPFYADGRAIPLGPGCKEILTKEFVNGFKETVPLTVVLSEQDERWKPLRISIHA
jgi:hypothetical protein